MKNSVSQTRRSKQKVARSSGFSLIELLIVIAIIGILAGVGYPSYKSYVLKTNRTDAAFALLQAAQAMERCKSTQYSYAGCTLSTRMSTSPEAMYTIALTPAPTASNYTLVATPQGTQTSDEDCLTISINHLGNRTSTPGAADTDENNCWN